MTSCWKFLFAVFSVCIQKGSSFHLNKIKNPKEWTTTKKITIIISSIHEAMCSQTVNFIASLPWNCWRFECIYHLIIHVLLNGSANISECRIIGVKNGSSFGLQVCQIFLNISTTHTILIRVRFSVFKCMFLFFALSSSSVSSSSSSFPFWSLRWFLFFLQNMLTSSIVARLNGSLTAHSRNRSEPTH